MSFAHHLDVTGLPLVLVNRTSLKHSIIVSVFPENIQKMRVRQCYRSLIAHIEWQMDYIMKSPGVRFLSLTKHERFIVINIKNDGN